jgi:outer membrane cobalamin receptor
VSITPPDARRENTPKRSPVHRPSVRPFSLFLSSLLFAATAGAAPAVTGTVVDSTGRALPRALVTLTGESGAVVATTFTYPDGSFQIDKAMPAGCQVVASLDGFKTKSEPCGNGTGLQLTLALAPLQESVVVSATRTETPAGQLASSVTVFDEDEIARRQHPAVADLLRSAPGAMVVANGSRGAVASLFVRGGESNYTKVLLDGIPLNEPGGTFDFGSVTTANIGRVELVRGAQSALFGSDAMAGVLQMFTARAEPGAPTADISVEAGSFGTGRASASAAGRAGALDYSVGASRLTTDNEVENSGFDNTTLSGSAGVPIGRNGTLRFTGRAELGEVGTPGQAAFGRPDLDARFERRNGVGGVTFVQTLTPAFTQRATYALSVSNQTSANLILDPPYTPSFEGRTAPFEFFDFAFDSYNQLRRHYATYQTDWRLPGGSSAAGTHLLTAAVDWDGERAALRDRLADTAIHAARNNVGLTVQHQAMWPRLFLTGGLRFEHNDSFGSAVVPRASAAYIVRRSSGVIGNTRLKASAGLGIKEPTLLQSFSASPFFLGNPDLEPERSRTVDAGIDQHLFGDRATIELTWFDGRYRNIISTRTTSINPFTSQYFNIGRTRARGVELSGETSLGGGALVRAGYTLLDSRIVESASPSDPVLGIGRPLFRRARHSGYAGISWTFDRLSADVTGVFVGARADSDFSSLEPPLLSNPGFATWDLRAAWRLAGPLSLTVAADNLTNASYMDPLGYPVLGRALRAGARVGF